jgi:hypothetical protein
MAVFMRSDELSGEENHFFKNKKFGKTAGTRLDKFWRAVVSYGGLIIFRLLTIYAANPALAGRKSRVKTRKACDLNKKGDFFARDREHARHLEDFYGPNTYPHTAGNMGNRPGRTADPGQPG